MINFAELYQFRNYSYQKVQFSKGLNVFVGNNGQGKTNLIEAVYLAYTGDFLRTKKVENIIQRTQTEGSVFLELLDQEAKQELRVVLKQTKKEHFLNQKKLSGQKLKVQNSAVVFTPESMNAIKSGPEERRALIDALLVSLYPSENRVLLEFKKVLQTRNRTLKDFKESKTDLKTCLSLLASLKPLYLEIATQLTCSRVFALQAILEPFRNAAQKILGQNMSLDIQYLISDKAVNQVIPKDIHQKMAFRMDELQSAELSLGSTLVGPHKHEIEFIFQGENARNYCSQGQQRALILAFKMAQIVYHRHKFGVYPLLFLDDVLSELDEGRCEDLIRFLQEIPTQVFMTTTQVAQLDKREFYESCFFETRQGRINPLISEKLVER